MKAPLSSSIRGRMDTDEDREKVYGLFADNDTTVNCEDIFLQHYENVVHFHGEHRLNRHVVEETLIPLII